MATAEYPFPDADKVESRPLGMAAQLLVVAIGTIVALAVGVALVLIASS